MNCLIIQNDTLSSRTDRVDTDFIKTGIIMRNKIIQNNHHNPSKVTSFLTRAWNLVPSIITNKPANNWQETSWLATAKGLTPKVEQNLINRYKLLAQLKASKTNRCGQSRYTHTIEMLKSLHNILHNEYATFITLDPIALKSGEHHLARSQFQLLRDMLISRVNNDKKLHFLCLLLITHDYGTLYGDSRHITKSGELCENDFRQDGFSALEVNLARLLVVNHSYFGDLLLGEASTTHGLNLITTLQNTTRDSTYYWDTLLILNMLDINASREGFLSEEKFSKLISLRSQHEFRQLHKNWSWQRYHFLGHPQLAKTLQANGAPNSNNIYLQYFHGIAKKLTTLELTHSMEIFNILYELQLAKTLNQFTYITLSNDNLEAISRFKISLSQEVSIAITHTNTGTINELPFNIEDNTFLTIDLQ